MIIAGCTSPQPAGSVTPVTTMVTTNPAAPSACGFTDCHGLGLACGPNPPQVCPLYYQIGDKCRQYAYCNNTGSTCSLVTTQKFDTCKSCVEKCMNGNQTESFSCEEKC